MADLAIWATGFAAQAGGTLSRVSDRPIFLLSDSTGETAERLTRAALAQFPDLRVRLRTFTRVRDRDGVLDVVRSARAANALLVFTLVAQDLRQACLEACADLEVEVVDAIGPVIAKLGMCFERAPLGEPSAQLPLGEAYFRRVEALEFAVKSDDGKEPRNLKRADLVLVGPSRTSKTPLATYLAGRGLRVANVPLVPGVEPPPELFEVDPSRVVALRIDLAKLLDIRTSRLRQIGLPEGASYGARVNVEEELEFCAALYAARGWFVVDVTGRAIEETATMILEHYKSGGDQQGFTLRPPRPAAPERS
jgi:regulator of PEP synthase PpsR (kinase-PPPase family)